MPLVKTIMETALFSAETPPATHKPAYPRFHLDKLTIQINAHDGKADSVQMNKSY
jgi:hypothetical protein